MPTSAKRNSSSAGSLSFFSFFFVMGRMGRMVVVLFCCVLLVVVLFERGPVNVLMQHFYIANVIFFCLRGDVLRSISKRRKHMAVGQNLRYLFGDDYPPKVVYFKRFFRCSPGYRGFDPQPYPVVWIV